MTKLIVNADDFGYRPLFNRMILEFIEEGAVTSTSVMVDKISSEQNEQVEKIVQFSEKKLVSVGLHVHFNSKNYDDEIDRQYDKFINIFGFKPSHIDIHTKDDIEKTYPIILKFCKEKNIPCKNIGNFDENIKDIGGLITTKEPSYSATWKSFPEIKEWLDSLQDGFFCINSHPGYFDPDLSESVSNRKKQREVDAKNIRKMANYLKKLDIELVNFYDLLA